MPTPAATPIPEGPPVPNASLAEPAFDAQFEASLNWQANVLLPGFNAAIDSINANATEAEAAADTSVGAATTAVASADVAMAAANFKGLWTGMTGSLNKPATVKHSGRFWLLLSNLGSVAAAEPGVHAAWTSLDAGMPVTQIVTSGTVNAVIGVTYLLAGASFRLNLPTSGLNKGDYLGIRLLDYPAETQIINFGSVKYMGKTAGEVNPDIVGLSTDMRYENPTYGWI